MEQILLGLIGSSPAGVATIATVILFLRYLKEERQFLRDERQSWHQTVTTALNNNTLAMGAQTQAMMTQAEMMRTLTVAIDKHDTMARAAIERLEKK